MMATKSSHKPNTATAQAYYNKKEKVARLTTETGAGQWGSALAIACNFFGLQCKVYMVKVSYQQKPYRRVLMETYGAQVVPSPSPDTQAGKKMLQQDPNSPGSLGIAISEAVQDAATRDDTKVALGSGLNHRLMHQTVVGLEVKKQLEKADAEADILGGCSGGGSNFAGFSFPFLADKLAGKRKKLRVVAVEPSACPSLTKGKYVYDFGDTVGLTPLVKMYTLGHTFIPPSLHAGGLRYHGMAPAICKLFDEKVLEAIAVPQVGTFQAAVQFARTEGILAAPEIIHKEDLLGKRGWQAEYSIVPGAPGPLLNQLASKNVDAIDMSFALAAKAFEDGVPLRVTGVATAVLGAIVARKDAGLAKVEDLKGRKIAAIVGTSTFFDIRALTLKGYGFDLQKDTQIVTATAPPDMVTLLVKKDVDAIIAWQPITDSVVFRGEGVYLAKQIDLWRKATGRPTGFPVHVCYLVHHEFLQKNPAIARDLNDAQRDAVDIWYNRPARAIEIVQEVTKLPTDVIQVAHKETVRMLYGLPEEQVDTLIAQLKINKEFGFLKSDLWDSPDRIRREFFHRV